MDGLMIFAWIILLMLIALILGVFVVLAMLPGRIAASRNHPQSEAVKVAGWLGALAFGVFWPLALVWAFYVSPGQTLPEANTTEGAA